MCERDGFFWVEMSAGYASIAATTRDDENLHRFIRYSGVGSNIPPGTKVGKPSLEGVPGVTLTNSGNQKSGHAIFSQFEDALSALDRISCRPHNP